MTTPSGSSSNKWMFEKRFLAYLWAWRNTFIIIGAPLLLLPLVFCFSYDPTLVKPMRCAYVILLMIILWTTESLPLPMTAMLPMVLYPLMSLVKATVLAPQYMSESNISFVGSILVIGAFERQGLHKRFALRVLTLVGTQPRWILAGFMVVSWFLSMWCSNTMTTLLLIPIVLSLTTELQLAMKSAIIHHQQHHHMPPPPGTVIPLQQFPTVLPPEYAATEPGHVSTMDNGVITPFPVDHLTLPEKSVNPETASVDSHFEEKITPQLQQDFAHHKYENMLLLAIAYSASIGGTGTVIGTGPNLIMKQSVEEEFDKHGCMSPLNFLSWMVFSIPMSFLFLVLMWVWMQIYFLGPGYAFGCKKTPIDAHRDKVQLAIRNIYEELKPMTFEQLVVLIHCLVMILLLVTRQLSTDPLIGWDIIAPGYVKESTATILVALSLFIVPIAFPARDRVTGKILPPKLAIDWKVAEKSFPIGLILLIGGGMAAAYGAEATGLAQLMASLLNDLVSSLDDVLALLIMIVFMVFVTEFMSNTACVTLMMPILKELAAYRGSNPLLFMFPTALAASFAFMFPVATPPNALVFGTGKFRIVDMILAGFVVNFIGIGVIFMAATTYGASFFDLFNPPWVVGFQNSTVTLYNCTH